MIVISDLHPGEYYTFTVGVINNVGISEESVPLTIRTAEEEPSGFPQNLTATTINSTAITVSWEEVLVIETNGIITHYNIIGMPDATFSVPTVEEIVDNSTFSIQFNHLEEFVIYRFTISARTVIGFGPRSPEESAQTDEAASSAVVNMSAVAITATRILVQWEAPRYPNGPISYFSVCINVSVCFNALPNDTSYTLINLTSLSTNDITVQPFTVFEGNTLVGMISIVRSVLINTTSPVTGPPSVDQRTTGTITVTLPSYTSFGKDLIFYGVIVTDRSECEDVSDFGTAYPNPQPRGDSNNDDYYIAAGWSDTSLIPDQFTAGDGDSTIATLLGQVVTFTNPRLDNFKRYCVVAIVHHDSGVINQPISRYVNLGSAVTRFGYIREIVGFVMTLLILLLIIGIVAVILIFLYRRYKTKFYSVNHKDRHSHPTESIDDANGTSLDIMTNPVEDDETTLINSSSSKQPIQVEDFPAHVSNMHSNDDYLFLVEFPTVEPQHAPTTDTAHHPDNAKKNRYVNIRAYDHSRVTLQEIPNVSGSDYINANFIDGYKAPNAYIAAQGPTPGTVADFWRMVWEQETATIVMLTNLKEKGKVKCNMYWPPHNNRVQEYGVIRVQLQEELHLSDHTIRTFSLQKEKGDERIVKQFHFTAWPDLGVPEHPASLLRFIRKVETGDPVNAGPIIVHCSAGVGRTGTFITISTQIKRLKDVETVDIFNFVQSMRYCRCLMVQTEAQYIFTHDAMLEVIECGETEVAATDLKERFCKLSAFNDTAEGLMNIEIEYERIQYTIHTEPVRYAGTLQCNLQKNRFHDVIPFDKTRCKLKAVHGVGGSDYVNANFIEGYHKDRAFVATQGPLPETTEDFWRMVWECKSSTIVMLAKVKEGPKVMCHRYWPEVTTGLEIHGPFEISLHSVRECPDYVLRELKIVDTRDLEGSSQHLKQYHYTGWPTEGVPTSAIGLLDIREQMEKWQSISGHEPIIVHCSGGCGRTGSFIAMCLLIDRLKTEGVVDIFQTVRGLRLQRPGMVCSVEQYDFVHKGILEYLGSFDNYANFSL